MPDVYVEVGTAKNVKNAAYVTPAQEGLRKAVTAAVKKHNSGMTTIKPADGKGIQVNVMMGGQLTQDGNKVTCSLVADLYELPGKKRFSAGGSPNGQASVPGKIEAVAEACVAKAVGDLMDKITPGILASQTAAASTGTANTQSPLIFITFEIVYTKDAKAAPQDLAPMAKTAVTSLIERKFKGNPRFTLDEKVLQRGSGMPAYAIKMTVESVAFDPAAGSLVVATMGYVAEHPSGTMRVPRVGGRTKASGFTKPPRDRDKVDIVVESAAGTADKAIKWILDTHP
jgi:hypothetical protein